MAVRLTRNVSLPTHQNAFIEAMVAGGRYRTASEVVREGLRLLEEAEHRRLLEVWLLEELEGDGELLERARAQVRAVLESARAPLGESRVGESRAVETVGVEKAGGEKVAVEKVAVEKVAVEKIAVEKRMAGRHAASFGGTPADRRSAHADRSSAHADRRSAPAAGPSQFVESA